MEIEQAINGQAQFDLLKEITYSKPLQRKDTKLHNHKSFTIKTSGQQTITLNLENNSLEK